MGAETNSPSEQAHDIGESRSWFDRYMMAIMIGILVGCSVAVTITEYMPKALAYTMLFNCAVMLVVMYFAAVWRWQVSLGFVLKQICVAVYYGVSACITVVLITL